LSHGRKLEFEISSFGRGLLPFRWKCQILNAMTRALSALKLSGRTWKRAQGKNIKLPVDVCGLKTSVILIILISQDNFYHTLVRCFLDILVVDIFIEVSLVYCFISKKARVVQRVVRGQRCSQTETKKTINPWNPRNQWNYEVYEMLNLCDGLINSWNYEKYETFQSFKLLKPMKTS